MLFYSIIYIALFISSLAPPKNKQIFYLTILFFSFLIGFRAESVGTDTGSYMDIYEANKDGYIGYPEPLYGYLCRFGGFCGMPFYVFQALLSLITLSLAGKTIIKYSPNIQLSLLCMFGMYFIFYAMNINRQVEACFIILYAYHFLYQRKKIWFVVWVIIAAGLHAASLILLPLLFIHRFQISSGKVVWTLLSLSFIFGLFLGTVFFDWIAGSYAHYLDGSDGMREGNRTALSIALAMYWMMGFAGIWYTMRGNLKNTFFFKLYLLSLIVSNLTLKLELGLRVVLLFSIGQVVFYPMYAYNSRLSRRTAICCVACYLAIFFLVFVRNNSADVVPYVLTHF